MIIKIKRLPVMKICLKNAAIKRFQNHFKTAENSEHQETYLQSVIDFRRLVPRIPPPPANSDMDRSKRLRDADILRPPEAEIWAATAELPAEAAVTADATVLTPAPPRGWADWRRHRAPPGPPLDSAAIKGALGSPGEGGTSGGRDGGSRRRGESRLIQKVCEVKELRFNPGQCNPVVFFLAHSCMSIYQAELSFA